MPLNMTKIAFGAESPKHLRERLAAYAQDGEVRITTRYLPKRVAEMAGGSLYWIHTHTIIGRSPIIGFMENTNSEETPIELPSRANGDFASGLHTLNSCEPIPSSSIAPQPVSTIPNFLLTAFRIEVGDIVFIIFAKSG